VRQGASPVTTYYITFGDPDFFNAPRHAFLLCQAAAGRNTGAVSVDIIRSLLKVLKTTLTN
jgi:hypothetical protein